VREAVVQRASNTAYVETLTAQIGSRQLDGALAASVKADALEAVALDMAGQIDTARRTQSKLEEPMGKLQRAGGRNVPVDTDDIAYKLTGQNALARMRATNAGTVRENIRNHRFADNSDASTMYMMMTVAILASSDNDPYFSAQQLNASSDALGKAGLDLENLLPDVSKIDLALGNTGIDIKDFNLKGVDLGDFHVDVSSGIDAGLSSLDAGGGMSMGGGMSYGGDGGGGM
jgi:hypothetical protein